MKKPAKTVGFGAPEEFGAHIFKVEIPAAKNDPIRITENYGLLGGENGTPYEEDRVILSRSAWSGIAEAARKDFNERLKSRKIPTSRWQVGTNLLDRLLGKELCVLAWASEKASPEQLPIICRKWSALRPEERWWLFSMTVAEAGLPGDANRGWRKALYDALSDGEITQRTKRRPRPPEDWPQLSLFGEGRPQA